MFSVFCPNAAPFVQKTPMYCRTVLNRMITYVKCNFWGSCAWMVLIHHEAGDNAARMHCLREWSKTSSWILFSKSQGGIHMLQWFWITNWFFPIKINCILPGHSCYHECVVNENVCLRLPRKCDLIFCSHTNSRNFVDVSSQNFAWKAPFLWTVRVFCQDKH